MKNFKNIGFYAALLLILLLVVTILFSNTAEKKLKYSEVIDYFKNSQVSYFEIKDNILELKLKGNDEEPAQENIKQFTLYSPLWFLDEIKPYVDEQLESGSLTGYDLTPPAATPFWVSFIPYLLFGVVIVLFWFFMMNQMNGAGGKAMSFGRARLKTGSENKKKITFADVAGADEEKEELTEVVEFLKNPKRFTDLGARIPRGLLLVGPPGTGKTYLAKAASGEAGVPFFSISGSDFVELYVGVGASRVRDTFEQAKKSAPCIVFIDEIDAVGRQRGAGLGGGHDEREQTLNQLLVEMDGFEENEGVIIMAATNRPDILDNALLRPGRFDRRIVINLPDVRAREEILKVHVKGKPLADDVNLNTTAKSTAGFSPADLENVLNESALLAARHRHVKISMEDVEDAMLKVVVGVEKKSRVVSEKEKRLTAFHEAGHAIVIRNLPTQDPVHQISIVPRGMAGGYTYSLPREDKSYMSKSEMFEEVVSLLGGRVAESLCLDDISTGASNDIERATSIARKMVTKYGMSDRIGPITFGAGHDEVFLGRDFATQRNYSENIASIIDEEIKNIVDTAYDKAKSILVEYKDKLNNVAQKLIENEKMSSEEFNAIFS
ncbi:MAG: ftsH1 [Clostridia bacterium]|nr:ftsH1 [Clostridia bacterium]